MKTIMKTAKYLTLVLSLLLPLSAVAVICRCRKDITGDIITGRGGA